METVKNKDEFNEKLENRFYDLMVIDFNEKFSTGQVIYTVYKKMI